MGGFDPRLLEDIVEWLLSQGADYAEARFHSLRESGFVLMNGGLVGVEREARIGVAVRAIVDGGLGFASSVAPASREEALSVASRALSAARTSAAGVKTPVRMAPARLGRARYSVVAREDPSDLALEDKVSMVREATTPQQAGAGGFRVERYTVAYRESVEEKVIVTSDGAFIESSIPRVAVFYNITASAGDRRANRWFEVAGSGGLEVLRENSLEESFSSDVRSLEVALTRAEPAPKGRMDVVVSPEIAGIMAHEAAGHPSEADRVLGREAAQAGLSFRTFYRGRIIGSKSVTVIDDPTIPGSYGFYLYDDEGVAARPRRLYDRGELAELLHNRETAAVYGVESNGAARAMDFRSEPIVRMSNTYIAPGDYTFEELVEDVKLGVYIAKYMEWNIDDVRWGQRYGALEAYLIRGGRLEKPVRGVVLEGTTRALFASVDAASRELRFYSGTCGKGEPAQGVPVWMGGPHLRLRGVEVR
ncbi:MAG: TldD/PmbA family protein [Desulfurococcales archaeon]|nr:TldD/PmbA family protein [Desulfurococcales archaeon]